MLGNVEHLRASLAVGGGNGLKRCIGEAVPGARAGRLVHCDHRTADRELCGHFERHHAAVDNGQAGGNGRFLDDVAVVSAQARMLVNQRIATAADAEVAAWSRQGAGNVGLIAIRIVLAHRTVSWTTVARVGTVLSGSDRKPGAAITPNREVANRSAP